MDYDFEDSVEDGDDDDQSEALEVDQESAYICPTCGEEIVVPLDISQGNYQQYIEDCPVCCHPNLIEVEFDHDGNANVRSESE